MRLRPWTSLLAVLLLSFLVTWMASQVVKPEDETRTFLVNFQQNDTAYKTEVVFDSPGERSFTIEVPVHNVTQVDLQVRAPRGPEGRMGTGQIHAEVRMDAPDGATKKGNGELYHCSSTDLLGNCQSTQSSTVFAIDDWTHGRIPREATIEALDRQEAEEKVSRLYDTTSWTGAWNGTLEIKSDLEFDRLVVEVTQRVRYYEAVVEPRNASA